MQFVFGISERVPQRNTWSAHFQWLKLLNAQSGCTNLSSPWNLWVSISLHHLKTWMKFLPIRWNVGGWEISLNCFSLHHSDYKWGQAFKMFISISTPYLCFLPNFILVCLFFSCQCLRILYTLRLITLCVLLYVYIANIFCHFEAFL